MIAKTPPMGWNSWDCYGASVTEDVVRTNAKYMHDNLMEYGWKYVVVDIQWYEENAYSQIYNNFSELCMDEYGRLLPTINRFPSATNGFGELGKYIHSLGLKFGIHIMRGIPRQAVHSNFKIKGTEYFARDIASQNSICPWNTDMYGIDTTKPGAQEYYNSIFELYAKWGVDFIKVDDIANHFALDEIKLINKAIINSGREMVLSLSPGPAPLEHAQEFKENANMWRITDDMWDEWNLVYDMFERAEKWSIHSSPGCWPDADMLPLGAIFQNKGTDNWTKLTHNEQKSLMALWSIMRSPLIMGGDLMKNDKWTLGLLTNQELLNMNQLSRGAHQVLRRKVNGSEIVVWQAMTNNTNQYLAVFNIGEKELNTELVLEQFDIEQSHKALDIYSNQQYVLDRKLKINLESHDVMLLKII